MEVKLEKVNLDRINKNDLDVVLSGAFVIRSQFGSLVTLRTELERLFGGALIYPTISSQALYVVHWNDLSDEKKKRLSREERD